MSKAISHWALQQFGYILSLVSLSNNIYSSIILTDFGDSSHSLGWAAKTDAKPISRINLLREILNLSSFSI